MYRVRLFAGASIEDAKGPLSGAVLQRHRLALIALLATAPNQQVSRDKLIGCLWPERDDARARHLLRSAVHVLRRTLGEAAIQSLGDDLRLNPELLPSDVGDFLNLLASAQLEPAVSLYSGPFLDGFHLSESPEFEVWLDGERARLARLYAGALEQLAKRTQARGDTAAAVSWWRQLAAVDPYNSRIALELMRALDVSGDRAAALRHARTHEQLLENELSAQPDPAVAAFAEQLRTAPAARSSVVPVAETALPVPVSAAEIVSIAVASPPPRKLRGRRAQLIASVAVVVLSALGYASYVALATRKPEPSLATKAAPLPASSRSIAVLPFTNAGGDPNEEYFSDGLTEELIAALARLRSLQVAARTSVFAFKGENRDVREIGKQLGVAVLVEGNVRKEGDRVRVHAQLINTADGFHIWNESYDRNVADIFELQTELALSIAKALKTKLTPLDRQHLAKPPTTNLEAHTAYLKGRYYGYQRTGGALRKAIQHYESAIAADPNYARAYAGLATTYAPMGIHGFLHPAEAKERLRALTLRALEIDPDLAQARIALAALRGPYEWDFSTAEKEFLRAIELDPEESLAHNWYGYMLEWLDRMDEALAQRKASMNLEPISANATGSVGASLLLSGRTAASIEQSLKSLELDSTYWLGHLNLGIGYQVSGDIANAIRSFEKARAYGGIAAKGRGALAGALALAGRTREARKIVDSLAAEATASNVHAPMVAPALLALGDKEAAIAWLEKSYRARHPDLPRGLIDPRLASLRNDPRFIDLRRRVGVKP